MRKLINIGLLVATLALFLAAVLASPGCGDQQNTKFPKFKVKSVEFDIGGKLVLTEGNTYADAPNCVTLVDEVQWGFLIFEAKQTACEVVMYDKELDKVLACAVASVEIGDSSASGLVVPVSSEGCERHFTPFRADIRPIQLDQ
jgi:hypothetical protein